MKTTNIKGKEYIEVNERLKYFRANYKDWRLLSEIVSHDGGVVVMRAWIEDESGNVVAVGHAYEKEGSTYINKTSYVENCETSAWGRALGNLGIGIDTAVASADEVQNAIANQGTKQPDLPQDERSQDKPTEWSAFQEVAFKNACEAEKPPLKADDFLEWVLTKKASDVMTNDIYEGLMANWDATVKAYKAYLKKGV